MKLCIMHWLITKFSISHLSNAISDEAGIAKSSAQFCTSVSSFEKV